VTLQLRVESAAWNRHIAHTVAEFGDLIPVIKGNGYGFGRKTLAEHARKFADLVAVGTVFETSDVPEKCRAIVLTPAGTVLPKNFSLSKQIVLTVGSMHDLKNLADANWTGDVVLKLRSSMNRYGVGIEDLPELLDRLKKSRLGQFGWSIHPPLDGSAQEHADEITEIITSTDSAISTATDLPWLVSHVDAPQLIALRKKFAKHTIRVRSGTNLWLGDKSNLQLVADVLETREVSASSRAGYRNTKIEHDGTLVMVGAGTAHGVLKVGAELSPFHFRQQRLDLLEPSHMHTSMLFVGPDQQSPKVGDLVEVQQPLTRVYPDTITWI